jgi:hypothetical protein
MALHLLMLHAAARGMAQEEEHAHTAQDEQHACTQEYNEHLQQDGRLQPIPI